MSNTDSQAEILQELKKIRELLTPAPTPPKGLWNEFMTFLSQYRVLGLAVAFILGLYLGAVVQGLVNDIIMPVISFVLGKGSSFQNIIFGPFLVGAFASVVLTFIIVAIVIFIIVKIATRWGLNK